MRRRSFDFRKTLQNPSAVFEVPEQVLADPRLDREGKRAILESWERAERVLAGGESKDDASSAMLRRVRLALAAISPGTDD